MADKAFELHEEVQRFAAAVKENAIKAWNGDPFMAERILHIHTHEDGRVVMCDSFERFFAIIWTRWPDGQWTTRTMYEGNNEEPYSFEMAMADANILLTG